MSKINNVVRNNSGKIIRQTYVYNSVNTKQLILTDDENALNVTSGSLSIRGGLAVNRDLYIKGKITSLGSELNATITFGSDSDNSIIFNGTSNITGDLNVFGDFVITGTQNILQGTIVSGESFLQDVTIKDTSSFDIPGGLVISGTANTSGALIINADLNTSGGLNLNTTSSVHGNLTVHDDNLNVTGDIFFQNNLRISGDLSVSGDLNANELLGISLNVNQNATVTGALDSSGEVVLYNDIIITGTNIDIKNDLSVSGGINIFDTLDLTQTSLDFTNDFIISGSSLDFNSNSFNIIHSSATIINNHLNVTGDFNLTGDSLTIYGSLSERDLKVKGSGLQNYVLGKTTTDDSFTELTIDTNAASASNRIQLGPNLNGTLIFNIIGIDSVNSRYAFFDAKLPYTTNGASVISLYDTINLNYKTKDVSSYDFDITSSTSYLRMFVKGQSEETVKWRVYIDNYKQLYS